MAQMNLSVEQKQTHRQGGQTGDYQRGGGGSGTDWEFGVKKCNYYVRMEKGALLTHELALVLHVL